MTKKEIVEELKTLGVEFDPNEKKPELEKLLASLKLEEAEEPSEEPSEESPVEEEATEQPEAEEELPEEEVEEQESEGNTPAFVVVMKANVKHNGTFLEKGQEVDLQDEGTYKHFKDSGFIE